ncbi:hypothetical protein YT1_0223 [Rhodococcus ruber]|nr:hypothetical protein YT1_0223 [Rhodococcus ruber]
MVPSWPPPRPGGDVLQRTFIERAPATPGDRTRLGSTP